MSSNNKHSENLSRKDIQAYLSSQDEKEKRTIEGKALKNDFDREALDGWASYGTGISDLNNPDKKFIRPTITRRIAIFCGTIALIITGIFILYKNPHDQKTIATVNIEKTDIVLPDSVQKLVRLPQTELISVNEIQRETQSNKKIIKETPAKEEKELEREEITVSQLPVLKPDFPEKKPTIRKVEAKEIYLNDLKLIDYRSYRKKPNLTVESIRLTGVSADKEAEDEPIKENIVSDIEIAYYDYIKKTTALLNQGDYKQVLARCNIILSHYPDDLNALFYSGLCSYNLSEYSKAADLFKQCLAAKFNNFDEEAEWLLAKCYEADGETEKAKAIFQSIKERGGYYSGK